MYGSFNDITNVFLQEEDEKMKAKIERERQKKSLLQQIQNEISRIKGSNNDNQENEDDLIDDETPTWLKMVISSKNKEMQKSKKMDTNVEKKMEMMSLTDNLEKDNHLDTMETPAWIKLFQERSAKLDVSQKKNDNKTEELKRFIPSYVNDEDEKEIKESTKKIPKMSLNIDYETAIANNEAIVQKSVKDIKSKLENSEHKVQNTESTVVNRTTKVVDRVRKVKSLLLEGGQKELRQEKEKDLRISKGKAEKIKGFFENTKTDDHKKPAYTKPKKPKRKFMKPIAQPFEKEEKLKTEERDWKWKHKSVSELYSYINSNRKHIPEAITKITESNVSSYSTQDNIEFVSTNDDAEFESYITSIHSYIDEKDKDDTESCFKDTIKAYLDLIEDRKEVQILPVKENKKNVVLTNTNDLKIRLEESFIKDQTSVRKEISVGKVDVSFFSKHHEDRNIKSTGVPRDLTKNIIKKYEQYGIEEDHKELYTMKRKLIPCKEDVDTSSWKKQQVQQQWKYKQKSIKELQEYILGSKNSDHSKPIQETGKDIGPISIFKHIDFSSRLKEEENKMVEFEKFMDEIHDYLETDTNDEYESMFKWGIHAYIDLIEETENGSDVTVMYERKSLTSDKIPKLKDIKAKLESTNETITGNSKEVGRLDMSSFLPSAKEKDLITEQKGASIDSKVDILGRKSIFETTGEDQSQEFEKTIVRRKIIDVAMEEQSFPRPQNIQQKWKYKKKNLEELQNFISKNKDIASENLLIANNKISNISTKGDINSSSILDSSSKLVAQLKDRNEEFNNFMSELKDYMHEKSDSTEQENVKDNIRQYLKLIEPPAKNKRNPLLPEIGSARKVSDIKDSLSSNGEREFSKQVNKKMIGKVSHFFKKNTNEKLNSKVVQENIASLLEPGKAKLIKDSLEQKPKIKRSSSVIEIPVSKLSNKSVFAKKCDVDDYDQGPSLSDLKARITSPKYKNVDKQTLFDRHQSRCTKAIQQPESIKSQWDEYKDPEEKRKAILAKHGLRGPTRRENDSEEIEDILNYESKDDMKDYVKELKKRYFLCEDDNSSRESSPDKKDNKGSHSSLLNILNVMKKAATKKTFSETKAKVKDFGKLSHSKSDIDLSDISKSCTDVRDIFEDGQIYQLERKESKAFYDVEMANFNIADKKALWERNFANGCQRYENSDSTTKLESISRVKEMFQEGEDSKSDLQHFIIQRSFTENEDKHLTVQEELEELRQSAKIKNMFRLERRNSDTCNQPSLRRTNSCIGVNGERLPSDLDQETMAGVSVTNKMVKAMFEQNAPKYKFGGSGSNVSLNGSKDNVNRIGPVMRPSAKPKEERKWVLDSINKFFDIIVEEEEEDEEYDQEEYYEDENSDYEYCDSESEYSEYDNEIEAVNEEQNNYQSTNKMRGLLSSVVSKISGSIGNLAQKDLMHSLKQNLGSQMNLKKSNTKLEKS